MGYEGKISATLRKYGFSYKGTNIAGKCPFCGHNRFFVDDIHGIFTCNSNVCQKSGGVMDFAYAFYTEVVPLSPENKKEAVKILEQDIGMESIKTAARQNYKDSKILNPTVPIEQRNMVYRAMIRHGKLREVDRKHLLDRGYTNEQIDSYGYISMPATLEERQQMARLIQADGIPVKGIPGFEICDNICQVADFGLYYRKKIFGMQNVSDKDIVFFLIPSYDMHGKIQFFQIAWDKRLTGKKIVNGNEKKFAKYTMYSTPGKEGGGKVNTTPGYCGYYKKNKDGVFVPDLRGKTSIPVIEGVLKTALYFELIYRKEPCIAQVGVNNYKALKKFLIELKKVCPELKQIDNCYDMDKFTNENVADGSKVLENLCNELGFRYHLRKWNPEYKGIDDYALAWRKEKIGK